MDAITGNDVRATDGVAGDVVDVLADEAGWTVLEVVVNIGIRWLGSQVLVPPSAVVRIS